MLMTSDDFVRCTADTGKDHKDPLRALISAEVESPGSYTFHSWREKRRKASLQCAVAIPDSENGKYFADIDIDLTNPLSDPWAFLEHHRDEPTDHLSLQDDRVFLRQRDVSNSLKRIRSSVTGHRSGPMGASRT